MRKLFPVMAVLIVFSMIAAACGGTPVTTPATGEQPKIVETVVVTVEVPGETIITKPEAYGSIAARVRERGKLICGIHTSLLGFGYLDANGRNVGFDVDFCRAVAAAILGNPEKVEFVPMTAADRGPALQTGEVDMLSRNATWTSKREAEWGNFTWTMFYDGQGFIVRKDSGVTTLQDMNGATICVTSGTTTEKNLAAAFADAGLTYEAVIFEETAAVYGAYDEGRCDVATSDKSQLASVQQGFKNPDDHVILDITISKEPLTPAVPTGDDQWSDIVKVIMWGLINAEDYGVTSANVDAMKTSEDANIRMLLGTEGDWGYSALGLSPDALANAIKAIGNYGEHYDHYFGPQGIAFTLPRGLNNLWSNGGLIYAPPIK